MSMESYEAGAKAVEQMETQPSLYLFFRLVEYNAYLERFVDIFDDSIDNEDVEELYKELKALTQSKGLESIKQYSDPSDAFDFLDGFTMEYLQELKYKIHISGKTLKISETVSKIHYSLNHEFWDDWETFESDLFDLLPNMESKNYCPLGSDCEYETDKERLWEVFHRTNHLLAPALFEDIKGIEVPIVEKFRIVEAFRGEYEPNFKDEEVYFKDGLLHYFLESETYGELLEDIATHNNELVLVDYSEDGSVIFADTEAREYIYLIGGALSFCF